MRWFCPTCRESVDLPPAGGLCARCRSPLRRDRRIHEPDLPAMGSDPADEWVAVFQPSDGVEADAVQEFLEARGIPALQLPATADWVAELDAEERSAIVHIAVPRARAADARVALALLMAA